VHSGVVGGQVVLSQKGRRRSQKNQEQVNQYENFMKNCFARIEDQDQVVEELLDELTAQAE
jgi:hypothetical protein